MCSSHCLGRLHLLRISLVLTQKLCLSWHEELYMVVVRSGIVYALELILSVTGAGKDSYGMVGSRITGKKASRRAGRMMGRR